MTTALRRVPVILLTAAGALVLTCDVASAHVRVTPDTAAVGSYTVLTFRVPTESATASTTKLEVDLPTDHPFGYVAYQPVAGRTTSVVNSTLAKPVTTDDGTITEAPTKLTWTADAAAAIKPGQFQTFSVSIGPVPDTGQIMFTAHQTYSDGSVVNWDEPTPADGKEPENPGPVLYIKDTPPGAATSAPATPSSSPSGSAPSASTVTVAAAPAASAATTSDTTARWLGMGGLALGAVGLVAAVWALTRRPGA